VVKVALVQLVSERAHRLCEYCRMPQQYDELPFEIDHIWPRHHGGPTIASNLALAINAPHRVRHRSQLSEEGVFVMKPRP
jgi:HNH endonuclease